MEPQLETRCLDIVVRQKCPAELRLEYMLLKADAVERNFVDHPETGSSECSIGIDASDVFDRYLQVNHYFCFPLLDVCYYNTAFYWFLIY